MNTPDAPFVTTSVAGRRPAAIRPTRVRWHIMGLLAAISALTYLDRLNLSIAGKFIQDEFALTNQAMGWILSGFTWGYAISQIPGGWLGDRYGPRVVLTFAILCWSAFTALTALVPTLPLRAWFGLAASFVIVRILVGVGEAATFPNVNKVVAYWLGAAHRATGNSLAVAGLGVGGALTPLLVAWLMLRWGWRTAFYACGTLGVAVALAWNWYATDRPEQHSRVNLSELAIIRAGKDANPPLARSHNSSGKNPPWGSILSSGTVWALLFSGFFTAYPSYIFYTWFYIYLVRVRGLSLTQGAFGSSLPFLAVALMAPLGGWFSDWAVIRLGHRRGRQTAIWLGCISSGLMLWFGGHASNNAVAILLLALSAGCAFFTVPTLWGTCIDLAPNFSGSLSALMNTVGTSGAALSPILTAHIAARWGWTQALDFAAMVALMPGLLWILVNADQNLEERPAS